MDLKTRVLWSGKMCRSVIVENATEDGIERNKAKEEKEMEKSFLSQLYYMHDPLVTGI